MGCGILSRSAGDILTRSDVAILTANQSCYLLFERLLARRGRRPFEEVANLCNCSCRVLIDSRRCCNISARDFSSSLSRARSDARQSSCKIICTTLAEEGGHCVVGSGPPDRLTKPRIRFHKGLQLGRESC